MWAEHRFHLRKSFYSGRNTKSFSRGRQDSLGFLMFHLPSKLLVVRVVIAKQWSWPSPDPMARKLWSPGSRCRWTCVDHPGCWYPLSDPVCCLQSDSALALYLTALGTTCNHTRSPANGSPVMSCLAIILWSSSFCLYLLAAVTNLSFALAWY